MLGKGSYSQTKIATLSPDETDVFACKIISKDNLVSLVQ